MAFPTTSVLDALTGASWDSTNNSLDPTSGGRDLAPNVHSGSGISTIYQFPGPLDNSFEFWRNAATYGPDSECFIRFPTAGTGIITRVWARMQQPSSSSATVDGYILQGSPSGTTAVYRMLNGGAASTLGSFTGNANQRGLGIRVTGTGATVTIEVYEYVSGAWGLSQTYTDTHVDRVVSAGYIGALGVETTADTSRWVDFGGGTYVPSASQVLFPAGVKARRGLYIR